MKEMSTQVTIGLMDSAYFVSKHQLLRWINDTIQLEIIYIEDLGSGSIYCQLIDAYYNKVVPMAKVNWKAKFQYQFTNNLKIFHGALEKINMSKKIDVNKLSKARYQDNLQMLQWLKRYLELSSTLIVNYNALGRRNGESFFSHQSQKKSYINRPNKNENSNNILNLTLHTVNSTSKKDLHRPKSGKKVDVPEKSSNFYQMNQIKAILQDMTTQNDQKLSLIREIVYSSDKKPLQQTQKLNKLQQE